MILEAEDLEMVREREKKNSLQIMDLETITKTTMVSKKHEAISPDCSLEEMMTQKRLIYFGGGCPLCRPDMSNS